VLPSPHSRTMYPSGDVCRAKVPRLDARVEGAPEITRFLSFLAVDGKVAASTQNQALSALLFPYRDVLELDVPWLDGLVRAKLPERLPVVLTREEVRAVIQRLEGVPRLMAYLLYGARLRVLECCRLRVQDVDFATNQIVVRGGKGDKDRVTMLPVAVKRALARHLESVREQHRDDLKHGAGWVELPTALMRKYPNAGREWAWQWIFPRDAHLLPSGDASAPAAPPARERAAASGEVGGRQGRYRQARHTPHVAPLVRDTSSGGEPRHPDCPGVARAPGRDHHADLHPRPEPWPVGRAQPGRRHARSMRRQWAALTQSSALKCRATGYAARPRRRTRRSQAGLCALRSQDNGSE
jgi:integrase